MKTTIVKSLFASLVSDSHRYETEKGEISLEDAETRIKKLLGE